jgi:hypothetical protein
MCIEFFSTSRRRCENGCACATRDRPCPWALVAGHPCRLQPPLDDARTLALSLTRRQQCPAVGKPLSISAFSSCAAELGARRPTHNQRNADAGVARVAFWTYLRAQGSGRHHGLQQQQEQKQGDPQPTVAVSFG